MLETATTRCFVPSRNSTRVSPVNEVLKKSNSFPRFFGPKHSLRVIRNAGTVAVDHFPAFPPSEADDRDDHGGDQRQGGIQARCRARW